LQRGGRARTNSLARGQEAPCCEITIDPIGSGADRNPDWAPMLINALAASISPAAMFITSASPESITRRAYSWTGPPPARLGRPRAPIPCHFSRHKIPRTNTVLRAGISTATGFRLRKSRSGTETSLSWPVGSAQHQRLRTYNLRPLATQQCLLGSICPSIAFAPTGSYSCWKYACLPRDCGY